MKKTDIQKICVIGSGTMGRGIALISAMGGYDIVLNDNNATALKSAAEWTDHYLSGKVSKGKMEQVAADKTKSHIVYEEDLKKAAGDADLIIEAIVEDANIKRALFKQLDTICPAHTIFGTNSSTLGSSLIAEVTSRPEKCCNIHYFNPVPTMELVEIVRNGKTSEETIESVVEMCKKTGKSPVVIQKETNGFVVSAILRNEIKMALKLLEDEVATAEDIDFAVVKGLNHPMGPFRLADTVGLDVVCSTMREQYKITGREEDKPSRLLEEKVAAGELGAKSGKGFYNYGIRS